MARTDLIISVDARDVTIIEKDGTEILFNETTRVSTVGYSVRGNTDLTNADCQLSFILNGKNTGFAEFSELTSVLLTGVENLPNYANWREAMDDLEGYFFAQTVTVGNLSGLATAANQSTLLVYFGENVTTPNALTLLGRTKAVQDSIGTDETGTTLRGRIKTWYDAAIAFFSAITTIIVSGKLNTRAAETDAKLDTLIAAASTPIDVAITPLTTQGASISQAIVGRKMGAFQWTFTKNGGTDGLATLYGTIDGTNYESLGTSGSQIGNASGIIRFDENWKTLKFEFTTQTGAGSTFGGTFYAS